MKSIYVAMAFGSSDIDYVAFGTIGWVKTKDNEVRQCKCLGAKWVGDEYGSARYEWKVAGIKEHIFGGTSRISLGIIYSSEDAAQKGKFDTKSPSQIGELKPNRVISVHSFLVHKYGLSKECFQFVGTWYNIFQLKTYAFMSDHTTSLRSTDFNIEVNENGIDISVPMLDGVVDGIRRYPTAEKAYASMKPLKTYSLDDDEDEDVPTTPTKIKVTIEVEIDNIDNVKKYATILE